MICITDLQKHIKSQVPFFADYSKILGTVPNIFNVTLATLQRYEEAEYQPSKVSVLCLGSVPKQHNCLWY